MKIAILSDTHSHMDDTIISYLKDADEIWHAGDLGTLALLDRLKSLNKPVRAVYGNIDGKDIRMETQEDLFFSVEGMKIWMTHIGGYPGRYDKKVKERLQANPPDIFICGHSHICRILPDNKLNMLYINPGAAGKYGFHTIRTMVLAEIKDNRFTDLKVVELFPR
jgi:uncharacterized protein